MSVTLKKGTACLTFEVTATSAGIALPGTRGFDLGASLVGSLDNVEEVLSRA